MQWVSADKNIECVSQRATSNHIQKQAAKVSYLIMIFMFLTDFLISGNQVPAQTTEPGLHLVSKGGRDVCRN